MEIQTTSGVEGVLWLQRRFHAKPEQVFDAWLDPRRIRRWITAPNREDEVLRIDLTPQVGGSFSFLLRRGDRQVDHVGEYLEIDRPRRLVFSFKAIEAPAAKTAAVSIVRLDFTPVGASTELLLTHKGVKPESAVSVRVGWSTILDSIADLLGA